MHTLMRVLATVVALLAGCAELPLSPGGEFEFELKGRFAARYRDEAAAGSLSWRHRASTDEMLLSSPFGQGLARVLREGETVTLIAGDSKRYDAADAETLTEQVLGFRVPLRGLADWVRARPSSDAPSEAQYAQDGHLLVLEQQGWRIEYGGYGDGRPTRLKLIYPGLELRLAIDEWK